MGNSAKEIGVRLSHLRTKSEKSQTAFANSVGIKSVSGYSKCETGTTKMSDRNLQKFAELYGVEFDWLKNGDGYGQRKIEIEKDKLYTIILEGRTVVAKLKEDSQGRFEITHRNGNSEFVWNTEISEVFEVHAVMLESLFS